MKKLTIIVSIFLYTITFAQNGSISGTVRDENGNPVIGANVLLKGTLIGVATNADGKYMIKGLKEGGYNLVASMIGYTKYESELLHFKGISIIHDIVLSPTSYEFDQVIVSASKYEQNLLDLPVSALSIDAERFSEKNFTTLDKALRYASGVNITLDQVSIRGSSGYSRGAGSRVLVALDGIPIYTGDTGEIIWELIPTTEIGRVEVIKGAASSLYGSTAIGGVINVISKEITSNPLTFINTYIGAYADPSHAEWKWNDDLRTYSGITLSHSRRFEKLGISLSFSRIEDNGYRMNDWDTKYIGYLKAKYDFSTSTSLSFIGTGLVRDRGTFNFWKDLDNALRPPDDDVGQKQPSRRFIFGMSLDHVFDEDLSISFKPSMYSTHWEDETESANNSTSNLFRSELMADYNLVDQSKIIFGLEGQYGSTESDIFGNRTTGGFAAFAQADYNFEFPLKLIFGLRYDYIKVGYIDGESSVSPKIGLNYKLSDNTVLRSSYGKGFRAPTLAEAFTSTSASGIVVKPNPDLKSETTYSFEIGINHRFSNSISFDLALFNNDYFDMIEPRLENDGQVIFDNVTRARIQGFETNLVFSFLERKLLFDIGYTYLWARDLENDTFLKYRSRHNLVSKLNVYPGIFILGADFRFSSRVDEIDDELVDFGLVKDGDTRVDIYVLDLRGGVNLFSYNIPARIFLNFNNILNYNYVEMIGNVSPIRNFSLSLELLL